MSQTETARALLYEWVQSDSLRKHCEAVAASMGHFARLNGADEDLWVAVGLLHDMDYEQYPNPNLDETGHPYIAVQYLRDHGWSDEVCRAILSHANYANVPRETPLERTLFAVDELSGFVGAVALVRPDKSIHSVKVSSVKKKMKDKAFAAKVSRADMLQGADELGTPIDTVIEQVIIALQGKADTLGLAGTPTA